ncbi:MAG: glycerol-3-phosphate 1-O-acyltransferase PlsY [Nitrospirales bacterium]|nr:glycerol-3-phosphate 1-O-acyltransferase PlsY [Nitrospirales bacterium]
MAGVTAGEIVLLLLSFVIGSIPTGFLIGKAKGIDLRTVGSGNIGSTNAMRVLGKEAALMTLIGDMAKGAIAVGLAQSVTRFGLLPLSLDPIVFQGLMGIASIMGHSFSVFLRFKGGKGVATGLGVLLVFSPYVALFTATIWLMTVKWTRISSLSALIAFGILPGSFYLIDYSQDKVRIALAITLLVYVRHTDNIKRLFKGEEKRMGAKA